MPTSARLGLIVVAALFAVAAWRVADRDVVYAPAFVQQWRLDHPDRRQLTDAAGMDNAREVFVDKTGRRRREDLLLLFAGLAGGCLAVAVRPGLAQRAGGAAVAVLVTGCVLVGAWSAVRSVRGQADRIVHDRWTLGDDALGAFAHRFAEPLRAMRELIPEDHAVVVVGTQDQLLNYVAWALHPRPLYPVFTRVDPAIGPLGLVPELEGSPLGGGHAGRWLLHLETLSQGMSAGGPAVVEVGP